MIPLQHIMLRKLSDRPLSGYSLAKEIDKSTGRKPSFGSIYPLLERMVSDGLVVVHKDGRRKIYTLTAKGREANAAFKKSHGKLLEEMASHSRMFCELTGKDPAPMLALLERLKQGDDPLAPVNSAAIKTRDILFRMAQDGRVKKHAKEINKILNDAHKQLEKLK